MDSQQLKVLVVDDMESFCDRFKNILSRESDIQVVGTAKNGYEAIVLSALEKPDVILMDIRMETEVAGIEASSEILKMLPETKIIITTVVEDDDIIFNAYQAGVDNYLLKKNSKPEDVVNAVYNAYHNKSFINPEIAGILRNKIRSFTNYQANVLNVICLISKLTPAEIEVLLLLYDGLSRQEISESRNIAFSTVKTHINNILAKFDMESSKDVIEMLKSRNVIGVIKNLKRET